MVRTLKGTESPVKEAENRPMVQISEIRSSFSSRIRTAARARNMPERGLAADIARALGVTPKAAAKWLQGEAMPTQEKMRALAHYLRCEVDWLAFGPRPRAEVISSLPAGANIAPALQPGRSTYTYPEISWVQAGEAREAVDLLHTGDFVEVHTSDEWAGPNGFWLQVRGPSMTAPVGVSFPEGMLILVSPSIAPENGQFVVAKRIDGPDHEATFKQLLRDAGECYLKPLNPAFPMIAMDETWVIVGTVIDAKLPKNVFRR